MSEGDESVSETCMEALVGCWEVMWTPVLKLIFGKQGKTKKHTLIDEKDIVVEDPPDVITHGDKAL